MARVVLAFSGSPSALAALLWLREHDGFEVITVSFDLGQEASLDVIRTRALAAGASKAHVLDLREAFAREQVVPALRHHAAGPEAASSLVLPFVGRHLADMARLEGAQVVAHGGDRIQHPVIAEAVAGVSPSLTVKAPALEWSMTDAECAAYLRSHGLPAGDGSPFEVEATLWSRTVTRRDAADWEGVPPTMFVHTRATDAVPEYPARLELAFEQDVPVAVNGVPMTLTELIECVTTIAGSHGIGRIVSPLSRIAYEAPAAVVLSKAHEALVRALPASATGLVCMTLSRGVHDVVSVTPSLVAQLS